jgi:NTE family protein
VEARTSDGLALVLSGGGARAAYQVGALVGIAERAGSDVVFPIITGVSAGAINAASLSSRAGGASGAIADLERAWRALSISRVFRSGTVSLAASAARWACRVVSGGAAAAGAEALLDSGPLRKTLSGGVSADGIDRNIGRGQLTALALTATSYATGRTTTFVHGALEAPAWKRAGRIGRAARIGVDHVLASSALPLVFPPVCIDGEYYGDGSIRQTAPLAPAIHLGANRLIVLAVRYTGYPGSGQAGNGGRPQPAQVLGTLLNAVFLEALDADAERLERVNRWLARSSAPDPHPEGLRPVQLFVLRPSRDLGQLAGDLMHYLPSAVRFVARGLGSGRLQGNDFLSYLLFERPYIDRLLELGRSDALAQWDGIARLLEGRPSGDEPA